MKLLEQDINFVSIVSTKGQLKSCSPIYKGENFKITSVITSRSQYKGINRIEMKLLEFLIILTSLVQYSTAVFIRSAENFNQNEDSNLYNRKGQNEQTNLQESENFNRKNQLNNANSQDTSHIKESSDGKHEHLNQNQFNHNNNQLDAGRQEQELMRNVGHKKGHHKSGFHNSYHKDESGSNSSYFDDQGDEGNQYIYDGKRNKYDGSNLEQKNGYNYDQQRHHNDQSRNGGYDNRNNAHNHQGQRDYQNRRQYYDDRENYAKNNANNRFNQGGGYTRDDGYYENNGNRPYYRNVYDPYYPYNTNRDEVRYFDNGVVQNTPSGYRVKIYEDPRYIQEEKYYRNEYNNRRDLQQYPSRRYDDRFRAERDRRYYY